VKSFCLACVLLVCVRSAQAQMTADVLGAHDLSSYSTSPVKGGSSAACQYCHAPHSGVGKNTPLWTQTLSVQTYSPYSSTTEQNLTMQPLPGGDTSLCLSCHDGTVAVGTTVPSGNLQMSGSMYTSDVFGTDLTRSHPFSFKLPLKDSPDLVATLAASQTTNDPLHKVKLVSGNVECTSCHEPHVQSIDPISANFLVRDSINGQMCLACHEPNSRTLNGQTNPLTLWSTSIHATSGNAVAAQAKIGSYSTVAQFACLSCHMPHNSNGPAQLLRSPVPPLANTDAATQSCVICHSGSANLQVPLANVYGEFAKVGHPYPAGNNTHDASEPAVLVNNRHSTCADCHNAHSSFQVTTFSPPPVIRGSQTGIVGVSAVDGTTLLTPAVNQYENCLRCHGTSPGKQRLPIYGYYPLRAVSAADPLNVIPEFGATATSSHPVSHDSSSPWPQPSLRSYMLNLDGITASQRTLSAGTGSRIFCSDCHNSDDNREFGGTGPNGPHGSTYLHIVERRYEFSQVAPGTPPLAGPGSPVQNLFPSPSLSVGGGSPGPYALCGKCHDLTNILTDASFRPAASGKGGHFTHISEQGFSCSVCHTSHGMGSLSPNITGERLVNFDLNVVAPNGALPISYNHATNRCTLTCHSRSHNADGTVSAASLVKAATVKH
jgi:decaheme cytochrome c component MtrC/MtrF-like protein